MNERKITQVTVAKTEHQYSVILDLDDGSQWPITGIIDYSIVLAMVTRYTAKMLFGHTV